jgi:hypothetical protein
VYIYIDGKVCKCGREKISRGNFLYTLCSKYGKYLLITNAILMIDILARHV